jgi:hypothetical protein
MAASLGIGRDGSNCPIPPFAGRRYTAEDAVKKMLMALAVLMFAGLFWSQPAEARCWWNGFRWHCTHYRHHYWHARYWHRPYYYGYYRPYYYRPYVCTPWPLCWG